MRAPGVACYNFCAPKSWSNKLPSAPRSVLCTSCISLAPLLVPLSASSLLGPFQDFQDICVKTSRSPARRPSLPVSPEKEVGRAELVVSSRDFSAFSPLSSLLPVHSLQLFLAMLPFTALTLLLFSYSSPLVSALVRPSFSVFQCFPSHDFPPSQPRRSTPQDAPYPISSATAQSAITCPNGIKGAKGGIVLLVHGTGSTGSESWKEGPYVRTLPTVGKGYDVCWVSETLKARRRGERLGERAIFS